MVELDAASVEWIQAKLSAAIEAEIDIEEFLAQEALEEQDSVVIKAQRALMIRSLGKDGLQNHD